MVDFYKTSCHLCTRLDEETYTDAALIAYLSDNFINVKINAEGSLLAKRFGVEKFPAILFATPDGVEIGRAMGFRSANRYRTKAMEMLEQWEEIAG
jgi:thioredoxin-related protein